MASNTAYRPVGIEDNFPPYNHHNHESSRNRRQLGDRSSPYRYHQPSQHPNYNDNNHPNSGLLSNNNNRDSDDVNNTSHDDSKPSSSCRFIGVCTFALIIFGVAVLFLLGVGLGFYVRGSQYADVDLDEMCRGPEQPKVDYDQLGGYHETLVYYIRGEEIRKFVDEFGTRDPLSGSELDRRLQDAVLEEFNTHRIDSISVEEHDIVVTSPDPNRPNRLQILHSNGTVVHSVDLANPRQRGRGGDDDGGGGSRTRRDIADTDEDYDDDDEEEESGDVEEETNSNEDDYQHLLNKHWKFPHVTFSPSGQSKARLVYVHYGTETDFLALKSLGIDFKESTVLIRMGKASVADKLIIAERYGAVSALLYWEKSDHLREFGIPISFQNVPYASAATYITGSVDLWTPSIPCQTISTQQAYGLLGLILNNNLDWSNSIYSTPNDTDQGKDTLFGNNDFFPQMYLTRNNLKESPFLIQLDVYNKPRTQRIHNIITTIHGAEESDVYTIVGSPRTGQSFGPYQDAVVSTSILVQLSRSFRYVHNLHMWKPRRGVKLISWGGVEYSNAGMLMYIMNHHHILDRRSMAYIDLGNLVIGNSTIAAKASGSLQRLTNEVAFDIPDPRDDEHTIRSRWVQLRKKGDSRAGSTLYSPLTGFGSDNTLTPLLHLVGVPTVKMQFQGDNEYNLTSLLEYSYQHHYKFHLSVTRILVMSLLSMLDNEVIPLHLKQLAVEVESAIWQTSAILEQCTEDRAHLKKVLSASENFVRAASSFEESTQLLLKRNVTNGVVMMNRVRMMMERIFIYRQRG